MVGRAYAEQSRKMERPAKNELKKFDVKTEKPAIVLLSMIRSDISRKNFDAAEKKARGILDKNPQNRLAVSMLIEIKAGKGDIAGARRIFNCVDRKLVTNSAMESLKNAYMKNGDEKSARNLIDGVKWNTPVMLECRKKIRKEMFDGVEEKLQEVLEKEPQNIYAANMLIKLYFGTGRVEKAGEIFEKICDVANGAIYKNMIRGYGKLRRVEDAERVFKKALENEVINIRIYNRMLKAYNMDNWLRESEKLFRKIQSIADAKTYTIMIRGYGRILEVENAERIFRDAVRRGLADEKMYLSMIEAYGKLGMLGKAEDLFLEVLEKGTDSTKIYKGMIHVYGMEKDLKSAKHIYLLAVENGKGTDEVRNALLKFTTNQR